MIIKPKTRGFICTTAHPVGCARHVQEQIDYVRSQPAIKGPKKVLVIGSSTGYGLASRITAAFGSGADTIGVAFEKEADEKRTATAGWYNTAAVEEAARAQGLFAQSVIGDAFSDEIKQETIALIRQHLGQVDMVVYSLASPRRLHPRTQESYSSVIKPIGQAYTNKTVNFHNGEVTDVTIEPATEEEVAHTVQVMGGEDWIFWIDALQEAGVLADGALTVAYSYLGPELTYSIYREGTIGRAKDDLEEAAKAITEKLGATGGAAYVSVNKALVTQSSAAIPVVPLYISLLFKIMKDRGLHEGCIEQIYRLYNERLYSGEAVSVDERGRIRIDELEMQPEIQQAVAESWELLATENLAELSDIEGYREDFFKLFGFGFEGVDYEADVDPQVQLVRA